MSEEVPARRSFRLKDKPSPEYAYRDYLKKDWLPPAVIETNKKYDDIFSSVVTNAFLMDIQKTPDEYFAEKRAASSQDTPESSPKVKKPRAPRKRRQKTSESSPESEDSSDSDIIILGTRLTEIQKQMRKVIGSPSKKRQKNRKPTEKSLQKIEEIVVEVEEITKKIESPRPKKPRNSDSSDIEIVEIDDKFQCSCGKEYEKHVECHKHLYEDHCDNDKLADCNHCGFRLDDVRTNHLCHVCHKFADNLEQHLILHYRDCTSIYAKMECRFCTKQFKTVKEVVAHEREKHVIKPIKKLPFIHRCNQCSMVFNTPEALLVHYSSHLDLNVLGDKIDELQSKVDAEKEECPFCRVNMSSRKSFRTHLLKSHYVACKSLCTMKFIEARTDQEIMKEVEELTKMEEFGDFKEVKQEVKDEIHDDGYPKF